MRASKASLTPSEAVELLREKGCSEDVISHVRAVSRFAGSLAERIKAAGHEIDVTFVESAALLHDIGRCRTHGIKHGVEGARIMRQRGLERYARVCERHIGAGIAHEEAEALGLPPGDYMPETLEEKVIAHADNLVFGEKVVTLEETVSKLEKKLGKDHPAIGRVRKLSGFIESITN